MMKKFSSLIMAAVLGSAITAGTFKYLDLGTPQTLKIEHVDGTPSKGVLYSPSGNDELVPLDFTAASAKVMPAVVNIKATISQKSGPMTSRNIPDPFRDFFGDQFYKFFGPYQQDPNGDGQEPQARVGTGSGVIINEQGYIVTNNHVVEGADDLDVTLPDNRSYKATVIGTDPTTDLALIKIDATDLPHLSFVNSDDVKVGEWVLAVGNPYNLNSTVTAGIISAKARNININTNKYAVESFLQTDAAINPGNSGGALVDLQGGLVGINTAIASPTGSYSGYGFSIPSNIVSKVVEDLLKYGTVQRGFLGITIRSVDATLAKDKNLDLENGVYVDSLMDNSAAKDAGIKAGDVITSVNGKEVKTSPELMELIARERPGDHVSLKVNRDGREKDFDVVLKNREGDTKVVTKEEMDVFSSLGADFRTLDKDTAKKLKIPGGVEVTSINAGRLAQNTSIREGFIITKINDKEITNVDQLKEILNSKKGGILIEGIYPDNGGTYYYALGL